MKKAPYFTLNPLDLMKKGYDRIQGDASGLAGMCGRIKVFCCCDWVWRRQVLAISSGGR